MQLFQILISYGIGPPHNNFSVSSDNNEASYVNTKLNLQILQIIHFSSFYALVIGGSLFGVKMARPEDD